VQVTPPPNSPGALLTHHVVGGFLVLDPQLRQPGPFPHLSRAVVYFPYPQRAFFLAISTCLLCNRVYPSSWRSSFNFISPFRVLEEEDWISGLTTVVENPPGIISLLPRLLHPRPVPPRCETGVPRSVTGISLVLPKQMSYVFPHSTQTVSFFYPFLSTPRFPLFLLLRRFPLPPGY